MTSSTCVSAKKNYKVINQKRGADLQEQKIKPQKEEESVDLQNQKENEKWELDTKMCKGESLTKT